MRCQGNKLAHILAKYAKDIVSSDNFVTWIEENSSLIESAITHDDKVTSFLYIYIYIYIK